MLKKIAKGVWVHESECLQSNSVFVQGKTGVLLIDAGLTNGELATIAKDIHELGQKVVMGFSTHSHWDHVLWSAELGNAPRYGTAPCAAEIKDYLANPNWKKDIIEELPPEIADEVPRDFLGQIEALPAGTKYIPWDGPKVRIIEHNAHAPGHAALLIEDSKALVVGDMLSDGFMPMLNMAADDPIKDYLDGLDAIESAASGAEFAVPGHGSVAEGGEVLARIKQDRAYVKALRDGKTPNDPRITSSKKDWEWVAGISGWQEKTIADKVKESRKHERNI